MRIFLIVALFALAGCKTQSERIAEQNQQDDETCKSYGLQFGTPAYADCRLRLKAKQDADAASANQAMVDAIKGIGQKQSVNTDCTTYGKTTSCTSY